MPCTELCIQHKLWAGHVLAFMYAVPGALPVVVKGVKTCPIAPSSFGGWDVLESMTGKSRVWSGADH